MFQIGHGNWLRTLKEITDPWGPDFWSAWSPATEAELWAAEHELGRTLDDEFREFYRTVGYGRFPISGGFQAPRDFLQSAAAPIFFITGSLSPGDEWATPEEHAKLWLSRGLMNPNPRRFTEEALTLDGVKLYDLMQFGSDGCCGYHQLYVGPAPGPLRYCLLNESREMEARSASFSEGLLRILKFQLAEDR